MEHLATLALSVLAALGAEPLRDLLARAGRGDHRQPVARWAAFAAPGQNLDAIAGAQLVPERHELAVDLCANTAVAELSMNFVGEIERSCTDRQRTDFTFGREDEDLLIVLVELAF